MTGACGGLFFWTDIARTLSLLRPLSVERRVVGARKMSVLVLSDDALMLWFVVFVLGKFRALRTPSA